MTVVYVYYEKSICGYLYEEQNSISFQYEKEWLKSKHPISVSLPLQEPAFSEQKTRAFFSNLLPEATIRMMIAKYFGLSERNDIGILKKIGGECAGAISVLSSDTLPDDNGYYEEISESKLRAILDNLPQKPLLIQMSDYRLSLAGAQEKLPVYMKDNRFYLPRGSHPSNYIIKPDIALFKDMSMNELYCMKLAQRLGLPTAETSLIQMDDMRLLSVKRYDRARDENGRLRRLHQEDFCQALSVMPDYKYESEGGPSLEDCSLILSRYSSQPILDKHRFIQWIIFNVFIGNTDAHAKNISLLYYDNKIILAPFYDLLSTLIYDSISKKLAMKIGGENRLEWIMLRHWDRLAEKLEVKKAYMQQQVNILAQKILPVAIALERELNQKGVYSDVFKKIQNIIRRYTSRYI